MFSGQSDFTAFHSIVTYLLSGTNDWHIDIDHRKCAANIFFDLKKAFDTVDHAIIIQKLSRTEFKVLNFNGYNRISRIGINATRLMEWDLKSEPSAVGQRRDLASVNHCSLSISMMYYSP